MRLIVVLALLALVGSASAEPPGVDIYAPGRAIVADVNKIVTPNGVQETFEVTLGGARQVVNVRGSDRANPILLFVHGGPAAPEMPVAWSFQRPWEDYFTVVQWDQRGSGRSFPLNDPKALAPTLSVERYRDDAIELIEVLRQRYGKQKVFLMGLSWGSIVGLSVTAKRPDLLFAYVGVGQGIDFRENERVGFAHVLEQARAGNNAQAVSELEAMRPYPGDGELDARKVQIERKWSDYYGGLAAGHRDGDFYFHAGRISPEYTTADRKAWDAGSEFTMKTLWGKLASVNFNDLHRLEVPIFLFLGRHDNTTPPQIAVDWFDELSAPKKKIVWFENSAHLPMIEEPGRVFVALVEDVRPLAE